jgi:hypothetical protein
LANLLSYPDSFLRAYKLIKLLLNSSISKSDNEIGKFPIKIWNVPGGLSHLLVHWPLRMLLLDTLLVFKRKKGLDFEICHG